VNTLLSQLKSCFLIAIQILSALLRVSAGEPANDTTKIRQLINQGRELNASNEEFAQSLFREAVKSADSLNFQGDPAISGGRSKIMK